MKLTYDVGQFRKTIYIMRKQPITNSLGIQVDNYQRIHTLKCDMVVSSNREKERQIADSEKEISLVRFVCRNKEDITDKEYVFYNDIVYNIKNVQREFGNAFIELLCEEVIQ